MENWLTDITTLTAVESLFRAGTKDPWAVYLAGKLADWYAYSPNPTFILPNPSARPAGIDALPVPAIATMLHARDATTMSARNVDTHRQLKLLDGLYADVIVNFLNWCRANPRHLRDWVALHSEPWVTGGHAVRIPHRYLYEVADVAVRPDFLTCAQQVQVSVEDLSYTLDVALRYARYGELVGENSFYLSHPLREQQQLPTMSVDELALPPVALSFADNVSAFAPSLTFDAYTSLLHEMRRIVSEQGLRSLKPGVIERDEIRRIAADVNLPAQLKEWAKAASLTTAVISGFAAVPTLATLATLGAAAITIGSLFWDGSIPRQAAKYKWMRFMLKWPAENQSKN